MINVINYDRLTDDNFLLFAMQHYENPQCVSMDDFNDDLLRIKYLKRLLNRYKDTGELKERLILNHIIVLYNVFDTESCTRMLFFKIDSSLWPFLKTFLVYLHFMPTKVYGINGTVIIDSDVPLDSDIIKVLRTI
jgi:hypothetical protein